MQGACLIGDDVYYVMSTGGAQKGAVVRYNLITGERISGKLLALNDLL